MVRVLAHGTRLVLALAPQRPKPRVLAQMQNATDLRRRVRFYGNASAMDADKSLPAMPLAVSGPVLGEDSAPQFTNFIRVQVA